MNAYSQDSNSSGKEVYFDIERMKNQIILDGKEPDNAMRLLYFKDMPTLIKALEESRIICKTFETDMQRCLLKYGEKYRNGIIIFETTNKKEN
jgi:hypothetical protein